MVWPAVVAGAAAAAPHVYRYLRNHWDERQRIDRAAGYPWGYTPQELLEAPEHVAGFLSGKPHKSRTVASYDPDDYIPRKATGTARMRILRRRYRRPGRSVRRGGRRVRRTRRYRRYRKRVVRRARGRRSRARSSRLRGKRFRGRRVRAGRRGRRVRRRQGFAAKVRKITGDCFNSFVVRDRANVRGTHALPRMFRIVSEWDHTREFFLRILYSYLGGPSTTAGTDLNINRHVWIQGGIKNSGIFINNSSVPVKYRLYVCQLKCEDQGGTAGVFAEGTASAPGILFATGSANAPGNRPSAAYWGFWDQTSRGASRGFYQTLTDPMLVSSVAPTAASIYEGCDSFNTAPGSVDHTNTPLSFIFPEMRKKLRTRLVAKGYLPGYGRRGYRYSVSCPSELRPADWISDRCQNFSHHSYFLLLRAESVSTWAPTAATFASAGALAPLAQPPNPFIEVPVNLIMSRRTVIRVRASGDHLPSFNQANRFDPIASPQGGWDNVGGLLSTTPVTFQSTIDFYNYVVPTQVRRMGRHEFCGPRETPTAAVPFNR